MGHPLLELKDKTAVVIGGTSGIGLALSRGLAQAGANVVPTGRREEQVRAAASTIESLGRKSFATTCDVTDNSSLEHLLKATCDAFGMWRSSSTVPAVPNERPPLSSQMKIGMPSWRQI